MTYHPQLSHSLSQDSFVKRGELNNRGPCSQEQRSEPNCQIWHSLNSCTNSWNRATLMIPHFKGAPPNGTYQAEDPGLYHVVVLRLADHILGIRCNWHSWLEHRHPLSRCISYRKWGIFQPAMNVSLPRVYNNSTFLFGVPPWVRLLPGHTSGLWG